MKTIFYLTIIGTVAITGCATSTKSILLGAGIGMATGALLGSASGQNGDHDGQNRAMFTGAGIGTAAGGLLGYVAYKQAEQKQQMSMPRLDGQSKDPHLPFITKPEARCEWIEKRNDGRTYEQGHYRCVIDRQSVWSD